MPYLGKQPASVPVTADDIPNDSITTAKIVDAAITIADIGPNAVGSSEMADDAVGLNELSATGTTNSSTFLRGDNTWAVPPDTNTTYSVQDGQLSQNNFTDADHSKLNAIEASADVTDATNVSAAGALMKSGGTMTGTIAGFTSTGIDDNADATAITIDSSEKVGIGTSNPEFPLEIGITSSTSQQVGFEITQATSSNDSKMRFKNSASSTYCRVGMDSSGTFFVEPFNGSSYVKHFNIKNDGLVSIGTANAAGLNSSGLALTNEFRIHGGTDGGVMSLATHYKGYQLGPGDAIGALYFTDATSGVWAGIRATANGQGSGSLSSPLNTNDYPGRLEFLTTPDGSGTPTERMRIDSSGNLGIGTTPESGISSDVLEVDMGLMSLSIWKGESQPNDSASYGYNCYKTGGFTYNAKKTSSGADNRPVVYEQAYGTHKFRVGAPGSADAAITWTDAMKIQNTGNVLIGGGTAGFGKLYIGAETGTNWSFRARADDYNDGTGSMHLNAKSTSERIIQNFYINNTGVGSIRTSGSSTAFNTSSDYRLKENVDYDWDATTRLKQLKPARFNFIADETNTLVDGFIAHEVSSVVPEAITGQKDAMIPEVLYAEGDELPEGKSIGDVKTAAAIDPQGIDQSKLVPLLVKAMQEQQTTIESLTARITALEG